MPVEGDESRLRQVFINLLDNAIKYTAKNSAVVVESERQGPNAIIRVRDTGIGIPPEHQTQVFERFYRVDKARSRAEGGSGLGLSIARSIVESHSGSVTLSSEPGSGTIVTVTLPLAEFGPN